jgi:hypothetical protein
MPSSGNRLRSFFFNNGSCTDVVSGVFVGEDKLKLYSSEKNLNPRIDNDIERLPTE